MKGALKLRNSWKIFELLLDKIENEQFIEEIDKKDEVLFGVGAFQFFISLIPPGNSHLKFV